MFGCSVVFQDKLHSSNQIMNNIFKPKFISPELCNDGDTFSKFSQGVEITNISNDTFFPVRIWLRGFFTDIMTHKQIV